MTRLLNKITKTWTKFKMKQKIFKWNPEQDNLVNGESFEGCSMPSWVQVLSIYSACNALANHWVFELKLACFITSLYYDITELNSDLSQSEWVTAQAVD